jgi:small subunit ribosomal protein S13
MLNIEEINLFMNKKSKLENLSKIYGINTSSFLLLKKKIGVNYRLKKLFIKEIQLKKSKKLLLTIKTEKKLKMEIKESINYLKKLKSFKGIRHKLGYPCRGQRTHTNARTAKKLRNKF